MKVQMFNWVQRRFHHHHHHKYEEAAAGGEDINVKFINGKETKLALLENAAAAMDGTTAFGGWKLGAGILAIGTFGFDPAAAWKDEFYYAGRDGQDQEEEIEFPLVLKADQSAGEEDDSTNDDDQKQVKVVAAANKKQEAGERITLADLFLAEENNNKKLTTTDLQEDDQVVNYNHHTESNTKKHAANYSYEDDRVALISMKQQQKKKLTKYHAAAARPINQINRMVRKMLKKKIHPADQKDTHTTARLPIRIPAAADAVGSDQLIKNA